jgi:hypothetical protein
MLRQIDYNLWVAQQPLKFWGLEVGTRMTVIKLSDDSIVLISPINIDAQIRDRLDTLGTVRYIIAPNLFHYLYLARCQKIYPQAQAIAPPGLTDKQPDLKLDKVLLQDKIDFNSELEFVWFEGCRVFIPPQVKTINEIVFYHPASKTLVITDSAFNFDRSFPLITQLAAKVLGSYQVLKPYLLDKIASQDKQKLRRSIDKILAWDFQRVIVAHGSIVEYNAKEQLSAGYQWLLE